MTGASNREAHSTAIKVAWITAAGVIVAAIIAAVASFATSGGGDGDAGSTPGAGGGSMSMPATEPTESVSEKPSEAASPTKRAELALFIEPDSGEGGSTATVSGEGFRPSEGVRISFALPGDGSDGDALRDVKADDSGAFSAEVTIPSKNAFYGTPLQEGQIRMIAKGLTSERTTDTYYTITLP